MEITAKAETYIAEHRPGWKHLRLRCAADGKVVYSSQFGAERAAEKISARQPMKAYLGNCGHWHIARDKKRRLLNPA